MKKKIAWLLITAIMLYTLTGCSVSGFLNTPLPWVNIPEDEIEAERDRRRRDREESKAENTRNNIDEDSSDVADEIEEIPRDWEVGEDGYQIATVNEDFFEWSDDDRINGITDEGMRQETLIIPARAKNFYLHWFKNKYGMIKKIEFEEGSETRIGEAFMVKKDIEKIVLPYGIEKIGINMFLDDEALREVIIPDSVTQINSWAFDGCTSLTEITLPASLTKINNEVFQESGIEIINIPAEMELTKYETDSFSGIERQVTINLVEGSSADIHFDEVFQGDFVKNYV